MGLLDTLKRLGRAFMAPKAEDISVKDVEVVMAARQGGKSMLAAKMQAAQQLVVPDPPYRRSTTALRRFQRDANRQYLHVSVPITHEIQRLVSMFGERWFRHANKGRGITYYRGQANG